MRSLLMLLFWAIGAPLGALVAFPWTLITGDSRFLYACGMALSAAGLKIGGVRVETVGLERLDPHGTYIFLSNHASNLDPPALLPALPGRTSVLVKRELFRIPVLGRAMRMSKLVPVDRANRDAAIASLAEAKRVMGEGYNMTIFVEGTRSRDGRLLPFKKGPFHLAYETGYPIVPVTIVNSHALWPKGQTLNRTGTVTLVFHKPIAAAEFETIPQAMDAVRAAIASSLPRQLQA